MEEKTFGCCFTGYRPKKFPFPLDSGNGEYVAFENSLIDAIAELAGLGYETFYSGMAMGFDIIAAECVLLLKKTPKFKNADIKLVCALPFLDQSDGYPADWKKRYDGVIALADSTVIISNEYYRNCYFDRNRFLVDNSDCVVTWFDGSPGGTKNTLTYAKKAGRKIINLNSEYKDD